MKTGDPKVAVAYMRISTNRAMQEYSFEVQRRDIQQWADSRGVTVVSWHEDELSGATPLDKREALLEAIASVECTGAGILVVSKWDRFGRANALDLLLAEREVERSGGRVVSADGTGETDDPIGRLQKDMVTAFARFERALISARIKAAVQVRRRAGKAVGKAPYGCRTNDSGMLERCPVEGAIVDQAHAWFAEGVTAHGIAKRLRLAGTKSRAGTNITPTQVYRIVRRGVNEAIRCG